METLTAIPAPPPSTLAPASASALVARYLGDAGELLREIEVCSGPRRFSRDHVLPIFREAMRSPLPRSIVLSRLVPPARSIRLDEALALCHLAAAAARIEITPVTLRHEGALGISELSVEVFRGTPPRSSPPGWLVGEREVEGRLQVTGRDLRQLFRLAGQARKLNFLGATLRMVAGKRAIPKRIASGVCLCARTASLQPKSAPNAAQASHQLL